MWLCSVDGLQFSTRWAYHKSSGGTNSNSNSLVERVWRKNKFGPSIEYQKINFNYSTGQVRVYLKLYQKALASLARWSIDTRVLNMCLLQHQQFFSIFIIWGAQNQSTLSLRLRSTTAVYIAWHESFETVSFGLKTWRYVVTRFNLCDIAGLASSEQDIHLFRIKVY